MATATPPVQESIIEDFGKLDPVSKAFLIYAVITGLGVLCCITAGIVGYATSSNPIQSITLAGSIAGPGIALIGFGYQGFQKIKLEDKVANLDAEKIRSDIIAELAPMLCDTPGCDKRHVPEVNVLAK